VLLRLGAIADVKYATHATLQLERLAPAAVENPFGFGQTIGVLDRLVRGSVDVVIAGALTDAKSVELAKVAWRAYAPNRNVVWLADDAARAACTVIADGKNAGAEGAARAYVCRGRTCSLPVASGEELTKLLLSS
jgi:uncharacterized protein YyaL (SSP411 family)